MYNFSCALNESYAAQVTVVGGGPAGVGAAVAAARMGARPYRALPCVRA